MESNIKSIREYLKQKLLRTSNFSGSETVRNQLYDLLQRTIEHGESNSMLLLGPRGIGKTRLVNDLIRELESTEFLKNDFILVKLHGIKHTDDRLALKSITFQMNLENAVDGKIFGTFAENLAFLLACLKTGNKHSSKSVIFVLDEFDLFCAHHNQTLLYNLFDISQSAQTPVCVLGITCRLDVVELLEKRVKSRFSHRQLFLYPGVEETDQVSNLDYALERIRHYIKLPDEIRFESLNGTKNQWNSKIDVLLKDKKFRNIIQRLVDLDLNERTLRTILINCIFDLKDACPFFTLDKFEQEVNALERDDIVQVLQDLNVLELCLIIAMKHHSEIYDNQAMNFEMIYSRYTIFTNKQSNIQAVQRPVVMKAFEHIEKIELIGMINPANSWLQKEYQSFQLLITSEQILEAVNNMNGLPTEVVQWANSSLV
ncbi:origin recognition complex subunit 4 [Cylas formicarius]|uniref:origin recognition complex subunit 4 n=1 Tax=Cylas formicarius TaxID=197179 RepID=UPI002958A785|nr:origin recognition complex subunit 4 [Cylas formicarius]